MGSFEKWTHNPKKSLLLIDLETMLPVATFVDMPIGRAMPAIDFSLLTSP